MSNLKISSKIILTSIAIAAFSSSAATAGNYLNLAAPAKDDVILNLGEVPVKKKIELKLGGLRTDEAELPIGARSLFDRMKMRAKRALDRQKAVAHASRRKAQAKQENNSFVETDNDQSSSSYSEDTDQPVIE